MINRYEGCFYQEIFNTFVIYDNLLTILIKKLKKKRIIITLTINFSVFNYDKMCMKKL